MVHQECLPQFRSTQPTRLYKFLLKLTPYGDKIFTHPTRGHSLTNCFNSLQTGRHRERYDRHSSGRVLIRVSIPFKREGTWKEVQRNCELKPMTSFNSLQTGRYVERDLASNNRGSLEPLGFNSLQTGKYVERDILRLTFKIIL